MKKLSFKGWTLEIDENQIVKDDPGAGTPLLVVSPKRLTGSYHCVVDTGEIGCEAPVPADVLKWLESPAVLAEVERVDALYA